MDKLEIKKLAQQIAQEGYLMSLGTLDDGGVWVADVIYIADENFNLYWMSLPSVRHSKAIEVNNKVACTVTVSWEINKERALQIEGVAEKVEGPIFELEKKIELKKGKEMPKVAGEVLGKGHSWYVIRPSKVELIHSELFGYKKQIVDLS
ncbi:MAG: pyridoxamine 5'-phosphate oxidase family protein [Patescibacteria group bacterium]